MEWVVEQWKKFWQDLEVTEVLRRLMDMKENMELEIEKTKRKGAGSE